MSRFNTPAAKPTVHSPITGERAASGRTFEGAPGFARDAKSELFLLAVSNFVSANTFYEKADARDERFERLVHEVAVADAAWLGKFVPWLRSEANMRTASLVAAAEAVKARLAAVQAIPDGHEIPLQLRGQWNRALVDAACQRADEPGELLAYWTSRYGRAIPKPVKRGVADAVARLYTERSLLKYDTASHGYRFGDVIDLVHPTPRPADAHWQGPLFEHALDRRHGREKEIPARLSTLWERERLMATPVNQRRTVLREHPDMLARAGMTWEALAGWLQGPMDAEAWSTMIPSMGYFALLRNLRNFDQADVSDDVADTVAARLADPEQVAKSRLFPFRFYAAHKNTGSLRWGHALEKALRSSLANIPSLHGRTLVLIDQSPSMFPGYHFSTRTDSDIALAEKAALFGAAIALRAESADLVGYGFENYRVPFAKGAAVLEVMKRFRMSDGTDTPQAMVEHFKGHDRVIIVTDEQTAYSRIGRTVDNAVPANVPVYTWNLAGYQYGHAPSGSKNRHTFAGLTDQAFKLIPLLEAGRDGVWPWNLGGTD